MRIAICIVTFQRPASLRRLLGGLQELVVPSNVDDVHVVVVDNDAGESARAACNDALQWLRFPLHYTTEKRRGIPQARNTAIGVALDLCDAIAFIDDDGLPSAAWLTELLRIQGDTGADAVTGPSRARFDEPPPRWAVESGLFDGPEHSDGAPRHTAYTGNVLLRAEAAASMPELFDEQMALCGGSDAEFFRRFAQAGHRIVWAAEAVVYECVQSSRVTVPWILQRAFRTGSSVTFIRCKHRPGSATATRALFHGVYCVAKGMALLVLSATRGRSDAVKALYLAAFGAGRVASLFGVRSNEYTVVHGR